MSKCWCCPRTSFIDLKEGRGAELLKVTSHLIDYYHRYLIEYFAGSRSGDTDDSP